MNWGAITAIGEIVGAFAVVASLIYVASQIRLANRISVREARAELIDAVNAIYRLPLEQTQIAQLEVKLQSDNPTLTAEETHQAKALAKLWIVFLSKVNGARESGLLPAKVYEVYLGNFSLQLADQPGLVPYLRDQYQKSSISRGDFDAHDRAFHLLAIHEAT